MSEIHSETYRLVSSGVALARATGAMILLHGRGGAAADILTLGAAIAPADYALLAPDAPQYTWYPYSFLAPRSENEPHLSKSLAAVQSALHEAVAAGIPENRIVLAGFSQGACLATEFVARTPTRYGGLLAFTGGLIGPLDEPLDLAGDLQGTPVLLSSGDPDPHIPWVRMQQSAELLKGIGGHVRLDRYPGRSHSILPAELASAKELLSF